jgi:hypothetical protein
MLGRTTYGILGGYWPKAPPDPATSSDVRLAKKINRAKKAAGAKPDEGSI